MFCSPLYLCLFLDLLNKNHLWWKLCGFVFLCLWCCLKGLRLAKRKVTHSQSFFLSLCQPAAMKPQTVCLPSCAPHMVPVSVLIRRSSDFGSFTLLSFQTVRLNFICPSRIDANVCSNIALTNMVGWPCWWLIWHHVCKSSSCLSFRVVVLTRAGLNARFLGDHFSWHHMNVAQSCWLYAHCFFHMQRADLFQHLL